jgi:Uma2 family endonuclease
MPTAVELLTFEELERLPEEPGKTELLDGVLIQMPPAKLRHNKLAEQLYLFLRKLVVDLKEAGPDLSLGEVHIGMGYKIGKKPDSWLIPDVSITHRDQPSGDYYEGAPLIAVEVISELNTANQVDRKIEKYLASGSLEVWVVYPETRRVLTHYAGRDEVEIGRDHIRSRALVEITAIPLAEIW